MPCQNCSASKTIKAHLIPQAFAREVRGANKSLALTNRDLSSFQPSQNGRFDDQILCRECDNLLGKEEKYAFETLSRVRSATAHAATHQLINGLDGTRLFRFAAGVAWKFALTKEHYGRIEIGPYKEALRRIIFHKQNAAPHVDAFMMRIHDGTDSARFFRAPSPERYNSVNFIRLCVGGFVFLIKIDKRPVNSLPNQSWLRANNEVLVPSMPANQLAEARLVRDIDSKNKKLGAFLDRVAPRCEVDFVRGLHRLSVPI